jgi:hypothetical protein
MGTVTLEVIPQWIRFEHKVGGYAGSWDWERDLLMFVHRGGTAFIDLAELRDELRRKKAAQV